MNNAIIIYNLTHFLLFVDNELIIYFASVFMLIFQVNLRGYVNRIFAAITCSAMACPTVMCQVFHNIREAAMSKFPGKNAFDTSQNWGDLCYILRAQFLKYSAGSIVRYTSA